MKASRARRSALGAERRTYYEAEQLRVVITEMPAGHVQLAHRHERLYDACLVLAGQIEATEVGPGGGAKTQALGAGDLVVFAPTAFHNVANRSGTTSKTLTVKFAREPGLTARAFRALCETDWHPLVPEERA